MHSPSRSLRRALVFLAAPLLLALVGPAALLPVLPAHADTAPPEEPTSVAAHYTGLLEERPEGAAVVVEDTLLGDYDADELERSLHEAFGRLGVDYYVVARAAVDDVASDAELLPALQDRVGEPGLYVLLQPGESRVQALGRGVDLPLREAGQVVSLERLMTYHTPLDTKADVFVDTLTAPDLHERAQPRWYSRIPAAWYAEQYVQDLKLNTSSGPGVLGEAAAAVAGMAATLWAVLSAVRHGRRARATEAGYQGRPPGDRALTVGRFLAPVVGVLALVAALVHVHTATLPEDERRETPDQRVLAPYVHDTSRVERVAAGLAQDPLYVDPRVGAGVGDLTGIAERLSGSDLPVYTAVVPMSRHDESGGDLEIFAHALHHVMDEDGAFVVVDDADGSDPALEAVLFGHTLGEAVVDPLTDVTGYRFDLTTRQAVEDLLDVVDQASPAPGQEPPPPAEVEYRTEPAPEPSRLSAFLSGDWSMALFVTGPLSALALLGLVWAVLGVRGRMDTIPGRSLRPRADRAVRRAARALEAAPADHAGLDRSLRETDTALAVLRGAPDELDLVGVVVLSDRVVRRLDPDPDTAATADLPVCMVNPLHGPAAPQGRGRGQRPRERQARCASCALLSDRARDRRVLMVAAPSGGRRPHLELARLWVTSGYGTSGRLDTEDLMGESRVH
ncbi:hypothetical protein DFP74_5255 [Nocardiopsis sp. Huas11]|uniref:hypothetical protein n=1 Tax=Nocardiopsis sp. Huas11 TaxID=2183912 RepID=UPI000EB3973F|nr:hypothetical protein [Nocardiopsis sp. Huas11]RKS09516.1 hypothetical protein DFP74_5255 [Nocardiopsis sp. Huas11]